MIDPQEMARFLVLEGASDLIEAFARIPPGPIRYSLITHAQSLAEAYSAAPARQSSPDPLLSLTRHVGMPVVSPAAHKAPASPKSDTAGKGGLKSSTPEGRAVERRLRGEAPKAIALAENLPMWKVTKLFSEARQAGVKLPVLRRKAEAGQPPLSKAGFALGEDELDGRQRGVALHAALRRKITLDDYFARRRQFLELARRKMPREDIAKVIKEDVKVIGGWFTSARAAGLLPPWDADFRPKEVA